MTRHEEGVRLGGSGCLRRASGGVVSFGRGDGNLAYDQNGNGRMPNHAFRDAAEEEARESASTVTADDDEVRPGFLCVFDNRIDWRPVEDSNVRRPCRANARDRIFHE